MNKKILALGLLLLTAGSVLYFASCKKEKGYSCNEELNEYAAITRKAHQGISRDDLAKFGLDIQFAIINSLSPENNL